MASPAREAARELVRHLRRAGHAAWWVGGTVRDILLGREPAEYDVATSARPAQAEALFHERGWPAVTVGKAFGVVRVQVGGHWHEVATLRTETGYRDLRHPDAVSYTDDPRLDAARRDFTVNAMYMDPETGEVLDFFGGREDLQRRLLRAVGEPARRFAEDHLRKLRLARFSAQLDFAVEEATLEAVRADPRLAVSAERINQELSRLLLAPEPARGLELLAHAGLLEEFLPEAAAMRGVPQPARFHPEGDVWQHTLLMFRLAQRPIGDLRLALAMLLHDVGKPPCAEDREGGPRFPRHAARGAEMAAAALERLRYPAAVRQDVAELVRWHMRIKDAPDMRRSRLRRLIAEPLFPLHLELHRLDCLASHGNLAVYQFLKAEYEAWKKEPRLPAPLINGHDLIGMGLAPGPLFGRILRAVHDAQLEGAVSSRREALEMAARLAREHPPAENTS